MFKRDFRECIKDLKLINDLIRILIKDFHLVAKMFGVLAPPFDEGRVGGGGAGLVPGVDPKLQEIWKLAVLQKCLHQVVA